MKLWKNIMCLATLGVAVFSTSVVDAACSCKTSYAGNYRVSTSSLPLTMRSGHGSGYSKVTSMPKGANVYVSKANGTWAHVTYNGRSGYASMQYLTKISTSAPVVTVQNSTSIQSVKDRIWNLYNYTNGYKRNYQYTGTGQCRGFANKVYQNMFNVSYISGYTYDNFGATSYSGSYVVGSIKNHASGDVSAVKNLFLKAKPGAFVQMGRRYSTNKSGNAPMPHSAIIFEMKDDGLYLYEANADNRNTIQVNWYSWGKMADKNKGYTIYLPNNYRLR